MSDTRLEDLLGHAAWLRRFAVALVRDSDAAEDVAQGTLIAAWQHPPPADVPVRRWLSRVAINQARDQGRSGKRREAREEAAEAPADPATPEQLVGDLQLHRALAEEVTALEEPYRTTVFLRYYEGLSAADIAAREGIPAGTVRWRLKQGLDEIRRKLDARHGGERKRWMAALAPLVPVAVPAGAPVVTTMAGVAVGRAVSPLARRAAMVVIGGLSVAALWRLVERPQETAVRGRADGEGALHPTGVRPRPAPPRAQVPRFAPGTAAPSGTAAPAAPTLENPEALLRHLLAATESRSYDEFLRYGDDEMKAAMAREEFERVADEMAPLLARGFEAEPLGTLRQGGGIVHLWKLVFHGAPEEDTVAQLYIHGGRVTGFLVQ